MCVCFHFRPVTTLRCIFSLWVVHQKSISFKVDISVAWVRVLIGEPLNTHVGISLAEGPQRRLKPTLNFNCIHVTRVLSCIKDDVTQALVHNLLLSWR